MTDNKKSVTNSKIDPESVERSIARLQSSKAGNPTIHNASGEQGTQPHSALQKALAGTKIGRYQIVSELGRGGMGVVYLAEDTILKRNVALKVPQFGHRNADQMQSRFVQEAQLAAQLDHPHICRIYDVGEVDGQLIMSMEYVNGKTLSEYTKQGKLFNQRTTVQLIRKVALAVDAAHRKGLIHRDLKPGNIMLARTDEARKKYDPKVMDFGLAKMLDAGLTDLSKSGAIVGTPCYMSKEQWSGKDAELTPAADVYSLGVILYEMLTGKLPYDLDDDAPPTAWFVKLATEQQVRAKDRNAAIDRKLSGLVMRSIARSSEQRFAAMSDLADALGEWLTSQQTGSSSEVQLELVDSSETGIPAPAGPKTKTLIQVAPQEPYAKSFTENSSGKDIQKYLWGGIVVLLLGITFWFNYKKNPDGSSSLDGGVTVSANIKDDPPPANQTRKSNPNQQLVKDVSKELFIGNGAWSIEGNELVQSNVTDDGIRLVFGSPEWREYDFEYDFKIGSNSGSFVLGTIFHFYDQYNFRNFNLSSHNDISFQLIGPAKGKKVRTGNTDWEPSFDRESWHHVKVKVRGSNVECFVDQNLVLKSYGEPMETGHCGFLIWRTAVRYRNIEVRSPDGEILWEHLPNVAAYNQSLSLARTDIGESSEISVNSSSRNAITYGQGDWRRENDEIVQSNIHGEKVQLVFGDLNWKNYDFSFEALLDSGNKGHALGGLILHQSYWHYCIFNIAGYSNKWTEFSVMDYGKWRRNRGLARPFELGYKKWYQVRIEVRDSKVRCFLNNQLTFEDTNEDFITGRCGVATWKSVGRFRNFLVKSPEGDVLWEGLPDLPEVNLNSYPPQQ